MSNVMFCSVPWDLDDMEIAGSSVSELWFGFCCHSMINLKLKFNYVKITAFKNKAHIMCGNVMKHQRQKQKLQQQHSIKSVNKIYVHWNSKICVWAELLYTKRNLPKSQTTEFVIFVWKENEGIHYKNGATQRKSDLNLCSQTIEFNFTQCG